MFVNPTSRLALRGKCTEKCDNGDESYEWLLEPVLETCYVDPNMHYTGTERPPLTTTTGTTTTTTHTQPTVVKESEQTSLIAFLDDKPNLFLFY